MGKRYCVVWNDQETPKAQVIEIDEPEDTTKVVLELLTRGWGWTAKGLAERSKDVHVFEITDEAQTDPRFVGTMALFLDDGESDDNFAGLIPIHIGETVKQALIEKTELSDDITFYLPGELLRTTHSWVGKPLLRKIVKEGSELSYMVIGFVLFIDSSLTKALETFNLQRWCEGPSDRYVWPQQVIRDFSDHIQKLCGEHEIDAPCKLE